MTSWGAIGQNAERGARKNHRTTSAPSMSAALPAPTPPMKVASKIAG